MKVFLHQKFEVNS